MTRGGVASVLLSLVMCHLFPRVVQIEETFRSRRKGCRCKSCHADQFGMSTGRASRASVLTCACLRASGASPRHSGLCRRPPALQLSGGRAEASACSSKRTVRFINGIALDECRARERYPARRPFYTSKRASLERSRPAGTKPAIETGRRCLLV